MAIAGFFGAWHLVPGTRHLIIFVKKILFGKNYYICTPFQQAEIAQLVEHDLAKVGVAGSSPVFRSDKIRHRNRCRFLCAQVVELVDTLDLKSNGCKAVRVQVPPWVQKNRPPAGFFVLLQSSIDQSINLLSSSGRFLVLRVSEIAQSYILFN